MFDSPFIYADGVVAPKPTVSPTQGNKRVIEKTKEVELSRNDNSENSFDRGVHRTTKNGRKVTLVIASRKTDKDGTETITIGRKVDDGETSKNRSAGIKLKKDEIDWDASSAEGETPSDSDYEEYPLRAHQIIITKDGRIFAETTDKNRRYTLKVNPLDSTAIEDESLSSEKAEAGVTISSQENIEQGKTSIYNHVISHLKKIGITVHNKAEIDAFFKEHGIDDVQTWLDNYYIPIEDKAEWSIVNSNLFQRYGNKSAYGVIATTANNWYLVTILEKALLRHEPLCK